MVALNSRNLSLKRCPRAWFVWVCAAIAFALTSAARVDGAAQFETIVLSGDATPEIPGSEFANFGRAVINDSGGVGFQAQISSGIFVAQSLWAGQPGNLLAAAVQQDVPIGIEGGTSLQSFPVFSALSNSGALTVTAQLGHGGNIGPTNDSAIWSGLPGSIALVAHEGSAAPGTDASFGQLFSAPIAVRINNNDQLIFAAPVEGGGSPDNDGAIWMGTPGSLVLVAREGDSAGPGTFRELTSPFLNDAGSVAFVGRMTDGGGVTSTTDSGIWTGTPGNLSIAIREGDAAPGTVDAVFNDFNAPNMFFGRGGHIGFEGVLRGDDIGVADDEGIWAGLPGDLKLAAREGKQAPHLPAGAVFGSILNLEGVNADGKVVFTANLRPGVGGVTLDDNSGIWAGEPGSLELVARKGSAAPGAAGLLFDSLVASDTDINDLDQVAFRAGLANGDGEDAGTGIWFRTPGSDPELVVRTGELLEVRPDDFRTVIGVSLMAGLGGDVSGLSGLSNTGQLVFQATFVDNSQGIFIAQVPEPSTFVLLALGTALLLGVARRSRMPSRS